MSRKAAASKQGVWKQTWQLAFQGYNISCQHTCGGRLSAVSSGIAGCRGPDKGDGLYPSLILSPSFDLSPGFLISEDSEVGKLTGWV
jgi:hypothetical protein